MIASINSAIFSLEKISHCIFYVRLKSENLLRPSVAGVQSWCRRSATLDVHDASAASDVAFDPAVADILAAFGASGVLAVDCVPDLAGFPAVASFLHFASSSAVAGDPPNARILAVAAIPALALLGSRQLLASLLFWCPLWYPVQAVSVIHL